jgi:hypothetical protein
MLKQYGDRAGVGQSDLHFRAELPGVCHQPGGRDEFDKPRIEPLGLDRFHGLSEGGPTPFAGIRVQRELRHNHDLGADIQSRQIHFSLFIFEYPQIDHLVSQRTARLFGVTSATAEQDQQPPAGAAEPAAVNPDFAMRRSLDQCTHTFRKGKQYNDVAASDNGYLPIR